MKKNKQWLDVKNLDMQSLGLVKMSGELEEIGYQLKELNKNIKELTETLGLLDALGDLSNINDGVDALLDIQKEYMDIQKDIIKK